MNRDEQSFIEQARTALDISSEQVSPQVAARLRQARHSAIAARYRYTTATWFPALGSAVMVLVVGLIWFGGLFQTTGTVAPPVQQVATDFEMLVHGEELEMFADLDFYLWLEQRTDHAG